MILFGAMLRTWREQEGLSQNELARRTGINVGTISRFESRRRHPSAAQLDALLAALHRNGKEADIMRHLAGLPCRSCAVATYVAKRNSREGGV